MANAEMSSISVDGSKGLVNFSLPPDSVDLQRNAQSQIAFLNDSQPINVNPAVMEFVDMKNDGYVQQQWLTNYGNYTWSGDRKIASATGRAR